MLVTKKSQRVRYVKMFYVKKEKKSKRNADEKKLVCNAVFFFFSRAWLFIWRWQPLEQKSAASAEECWKGAKGAVLVREMQC